MSIEINLNGKMQNAYRSRETQGFLDSLGVKNTPDLDITIDVTSKQKPLLFAAGDVYSFRYNDFGQEYTIVRKHYGWTAGVTDTDVAIAVNDGRAYRCRLVRA